MSCRKGLVNFISREDVLTPVEDSVSMFVPDMSLSVRDIMLRFAYVDQNTILQNALNGYIDDDDDDWTGFEDLKTLDIAELQELSHKAQQIIDDYQQAQTKPSKGEPTE